MWDRQKSLLASSPWTCPPEKATWPGFCGSPRDHLCTHKGKAVAFYKMRPCTLCFSVLFLLQDTGWPLSPGGPLPSIGGANGPLPQHGAVLLRCCTAHGPVVRGADPFRPEAKGVRQNNPRDRTTGSKGMCIWRVGVRMSTAGRRPQNVSGHPTCHV